MFFDLRHALRARPHDVAAQLLTTPEMIVALETGQFEVLPPWPETVRVVMAFTALAGIDGRPVLAAIADVLNDAGRQGEVQAIQPAHDSFAQTALIEHAEVAAPVSHAAHSDRSPVAKWKQAGSALAKGAKRLPAGALKHVRQRPERAFYAVSLPLGILLLLLNTSALQAAFSHVPRPVVRLAQDVRHFFQERFAPVHEGLRWIDVDDPRRRRGDKLR